MDILIKVLAIILLVSLCFGTTISFTGTFNYLNVFMGTVQNALESVKGIIGLNVYNLPIDSMVVADTIIDGKSIKQRIWDQYFLMMKEAQSDGYTGPYNLHLDDIILVNPYVFYVELEGVVVEAIKFTCKGRFIDSLEENDFQVLWLNPLNLLDSHDARHQDYVFYDGVLPLSNQFTTFYYYTNDFSILPIFDFHAISTLRTNFFFDIANSIVSFQYYPLDDIYPADDISLNEYMQVIGVYNPNV